MSGKRLSLFISIALYAASFIVLPASVFASEQQHFNVIINQVRGQECCDAGSVDFFTNQLRKVAQDNLSAGFALRFDTLSDQDFLTVITSSLASTNQTVEFGALLEITPELAKQANVPYKGSDAQWYEAQNVFLIGYSQDDRKKIIDAFMTLYKEKVGSFPRFSSAWMIDSWSLKYLKETYGVQVHQITREQFGTDSYTLYGGPMQQPYWPSDNWALIPQPDNYSQPLIVRQTIMDPVFNYGDRSNSYTSQPNDYAIRGDTAEYFGHLFTQAHQQQNQYTFTLIGLENSMAKEFQNEFNEQLTYIKNWQDDTHKNVTPSEFVSWLKTQPTEKVIVNEGTSKNQQEEKAWWITTSAYRARVRLSNGELSITDLRLYDPLFTDPYLTNVSTKLGWWIVPYVLDASRSYNDVANQLTVHNDTLLNRSEKYGQPQRLTITTAAKAVAMQRDGNDIVFIDQEKELLRFSDDQFVVTQPILGVGNVENIASSLTWVDEKNNPLWGFSTSVESSRTHFKPFVNITDLNPLRSTFSTELFPELDTATIDTSASYLHTNNAFAIAGRNPVRLVLFPRDKSGNGILLNHEPAVTTTNPTTNITIYPQSGSNGMVFIDLENAKPGKTQVTIQESEFKKEMTVYFAPHCAKTPLYCVQHPKQTWWFIRSVVGDKLRFLQQEKDTSEQFVN